MRWNVTFNTHEILQDFEIAATNALQETGSLQEQVAKNQLWPGHGVDTEAMKKSTHYAPGGYPWDADAVPASPEAPERGGQKHVPAKIGDQFVIETGSGQAYAIYYHEKKDAFVRNAVNQVNQRLPDRLAREMKARGY